MAENLQSLTDEGLYGSVVLCGGKSSRMGRSKADLLFGAETMLQRVVRILSQVVNPIVLVAAADQVIPEFDSQTCSVVVARDELEFAGPLAGLGVGLRRLATTSPNTIAAYVTSCDVPFLNPDFVQELFRQIEDYDVVVPFDEKFMHPLAAVYRTSLAAQTERLVHAGERRPRSLIESVRTKRISTKSLDSIDPGLRTLLNLNSPDEYKSALAIAGLPKPDWLD